MTKVNRSSIPDAIRIQDKRFEEEEKNLPFSSEQFQKLTNLLADFCQLLSSPPNSLLLSDVGTASIDVSMIHLYCTSDFDYKELLYSMTRKEVLLQYNTYVKNHWISIKSLAVYLTLLLKEKNYNCTIYRHKSLYGGSVFTLTLQVSLPDIHFENNPELTRLSESKRTALKMSLNAAYGYKDEEKMKKSNLTEMFNQITNADWSCFSVIDFVNYQSMLENDMLEADHYIGEVRFYDYICEISYEAHDDMLHVFVYKNSDPHNILSTRIFDDAGLPCTYDEFQGLLGEYLYDFIMEQGVR